MFLGDSDSDEPIHSKMPPIIPNNKDDSDYPDESNEVILKVDGHR